MVMECGEHSIPWSRIKSGYKFPDGKQGRMVDALA